MRFLWERKLNYPRRNRRFFLTCLAHDSLHNHYQTNFVLMQKYNYSLRDLEDMIPYEREIYLMELMKYLEEKRLREMQ